MKQPLICLLFLIVFFSCGTSAVVKEAKATVAGDWQLTSINFPGEGKDIKVSLLNNIPVACLEGSSWNFIRNNNTGSYEPEGFGCEEGPNFFIWALSENEVATKEFDLLLKPTDAEFNSTTGNQGYRIDLVRLSENEMLWEQTITFEGEPFTIKMNFIKI